MRNLFAVVGAVMTLSAGALEVTDVSARQRWPWNGLVDVDFSIQDTGADATFYRVDLTASFDGISGEGVAAKTFLTDPVVSGGGGHRIVWNMEADYPGVVASNLTVKVRVAPFGELEPVYLVIDISSGPDSTSYPTRYSFTAPNLADDTCRTTEIWLKRVPAGMFTMGYQNGGWTSLPAHDVTLTKPFYMAIFETTQKQWERVMGTWPSFFANEDYRDARPVENVTFWQIRGYNGWYGDAAEPPNTTFVGRLRQRAGLGGLDLPSEAQWSYTYRAGTTTLFYMNSDSVLDIEGKARTGGWSGETRSDDSAQNLSKGTAKVGTYKANPWGFYDFIGNVAEYVPDPSNVADWTNYDKAKLTTVDPRYPRLSGDSGTQYSGTTCGTSYNTLLGSNDHAYYLRNYTVYQGMTASRFAGFRICVNAQ